MKCRLYDSYSFPHEKKQHGFALMPIVLSVLILGALMGVGMGLIAPRLKKEKYNETNRTITAAVQTVISWSGANQKIPNSTQFATVVRNGYDAWKKPLVYAYDNDLISSSTGGVCGRRTTRITSGTTANVALLIISGGDDYRVDSTPNTSGSYNGNVTASSADIVRLVLLKELKNAAGCYSGTLGRLRLINNRLPGACIGQPYQATLYAEEGVPFASGGDYKWCVKGTLPGGMTTTPNTPNCPSTTDCASLGTEAASQWSQADDLRISGTPTATGSYPMGVLVRDNNDNNTSSANDNCEQKIFSLAVASCGGGP